MKGTAYMCSGYLRTVADITRWLNDVRLFTGVQEVVEFTVIPELNVLLKNSDEDDYYRPFSVIAEVIYKNS